MTFDYSKYIQSAAWKAKSLARREKSKWRCFICKYDYKGKCHLTVHHTPEAYEKMPNETVDDLFALCWDHHSKGRLTAAEIYQWRKSYRWRKWTGLAVRLIWHAVVALARLLLRIAVSGTKWCFRGVSLLGKSLIRHKTKDGVHENESVSL